MLVSLSPCLAAWPGLFGAAVLSEGRYLLGTRESCVEGWVGACPGMPSTDSETARPRWEAGSQMSPSVGGGRGGSAEMRQAEFRRCQDPRGTARAASVPRPRPCYQLSCLKLGSVAAQGRAREPNLTVKSEEVREGEPRTQVFLTDCVCVYTWVCVCTRGCVCTCELGVCTWVCVCASSPEATHPVPPLC